MSSKAWSGNTLFDVYDTHAELTLLGDEFPHRYRLAQDDVFDLATAAFLATALFQEGTGSKMAMTISQIDEVLAEIDRFQRAARAAKTVIAVDAVRFNQKVERREREAEEPPHLKRAVIDQWTLTTGSRETGALRRASLDLTRALSELRRPR